MAGRLTYSLLHGFRGGDAQQIQRIVHRNLQRFHQAEPLVGELRILRVVHPGAVVITDRKSVV